MHVLILALGGDRKTSAAAEASIVSGAGGHAAVITDSASGWELVPGAALIDLSKAERRHPANYLEWLVVFRLPRIASGLVARFSWSARIPPAIERLSWWMHRKVYRRRLYEPYLRPWVMRRLAVTAAAELHKKHAINQVVVADPASLEAGLSLVKRHPALRVVFSIDSSTLAGSGEPAQREIVGR